MNSIDKMNRSLSRFNKRVMQHAKTLPPKKIVEFQKAIVLEALKRIIERTPVDTGRARGNWQVTIAKLAKGVIGAKQKSTGVLKTERPPLRPEDEKTIEKGVAALTGLPPYQVVFISNNLEYIQFLEDGHSDQTPPNCMVRLTVLEMSDLFGKGLRSTFG